jgi:muconolactone delta-isomerase
VLERLWLLPGQGRALGLGLAQGVAQMETIVRSLPLDAWMTTEITPLTAHPSEPVVTGSGAETTRTRLDARSALARLAASTVA